MIGFLAKGIIALGVLLGIVWVLIFIISMLWNIIKYGVFKCED